MNLRKAIKSAVLVGAVSAVMAPGLSVAGTPGGVAFGGWTDNGTAGITATCGGTLAGCDAGMTETGFLQRQVTDGSGNTFIQTVITDTGFSDENFVKMGGTGGIADQSNISEVAGTVAFDTTATIFTGELKTMMDSKVNIVQSLVDTTVANTFTAGFTFDHNMAASQGLTGGGMYLDVTLTGSIGTAAFGSSFAQNELKYEGGSTAEQAAYAGKELLNTATVTDGDLTQTVELREVTGGFLADAGDIVGGQGSSEAFTAEGSIDLVLINQDVTGVGSFGMEHFMGNETMGMVKDVIWDGSTATATATYDDTNLGTPFNL